MEDYAVDYYKRRCAELEAELEELGAQFKQLEGKAVLWGGALGALLMLRPDGIFDTTVDEMRPDTEKLLAFFLSPKTDRVRVIVGPPDGMQERFQAWLLEAVRH